ncbi:hypothetical protein SRB5_46870 [Streptomyces sp. RB5]|uniref:Tat pathway signal protein n=1 Tax=Streptomyces smaragdinus TaxID=2585196 RepID=A0A7K0CM09_9ACTN|nr:Tat pathway signal protein [Streptomyces smaragdinus]MQY14519.1 hypothetical protein [Streptomyces smaragdinus]
MSRTRGTAPHTVLFALLALLAALALPALPASAAVRTAADPGPCTELALAPYGDPGDAVAEGTLAPDEAACHTIEAAAGRHQFSLLDHYGLSVSVPGLPDPGACTSGGSGVTWCDLPESGTYTVVVTNTYWDPEDYRLFVTPLTATEGCAGPVGTSWDQPATAVSAGGLYRVDCRPFEAESGERVVVYANTTSYGYVHQWITDESGTEICARDYEEHGCVLPGDGPYRVLSYISEVEREPDYELQIRRLSHPEGCPKAVTGTYGEAPGTGPVRCRALVVPAAGPYAVRAVDGEGARLGSFVYDRDGRIVCREDTWCDFSAAGTYTLVAGDPDRVAEPVYATAFLRLDSGAGCVRARAGTYTDAFSGPGQFDCLVLPSPAGGRIAALTPREDYDVDHPELRVIDRTGARQCGLPELTAGTCRLTGTGPFRLLATAGEWIESGRYGVFLLRTDTVPDCPVLPRGTFADGSRAARLATDDTVFAGCLTIPASQHTAREMLQLERVAGDAEANFSVVDTAGREACSRQVTENAFTGCSLTPGLAHTVLFTGHQEPAAYRLTRRDVTATAPGCPATPVTAIGGRSVAGSSGGTMVLRCHRVTTPAASDAVRVDVRDAHGATNAYVMGSDGESRCSNFGRACVAEGSASYQVITWVPADREVPAEHRIDAWRVATVDGFAAECPRIPSVAYGYGPLTGTLSEDTGSAVCAVLPAGRSDQYDTVITDAAGSENTARPSLYTVDWYDGCFGYGLPGRYDCSTNAMRDRTGSVLFVLGLPEASGRTTYTAELTCRYSPCGGGATVT